MGLVAGVGAAEFPFTLPRGYCDDAGALHREGAMRMSKAYDEIAPLRDPRVQANPGYLLIVVLSRVIVRLDGVEHITTNVIERLPSVDLIYLQDLYRRINESNHSRLLASAGTHTATIAMTCPHCNGAFEVDAGPPGNHQLPLGTDSPRG